MFAKIFESIYDGTLADHWQALVTFQQMLILADANGVVDMTPRSIHRRTGIPMEIIEAGIKVLERPDQSSRSKEMDGCRIARLSQDREWGWFIVNHSIYRARITAEEKREADRVRIADKRAAAKRTNGDESQLDATCRDVSQGVADVAHTEAETDTEEEKHSSVGEAHATDSRETDDGNQRARETAAGRACRLMLDAGCGHANPGHVDLVAALREGVTPELLADTVREAVKANKSKPFAWAIATARSRHLVGATPIRGSPDAPINKQVALEARNKAAAQEWLLSQKST